MKTKTLINFIKNHSFFIYAIILPIIFFIILIIKNPGLFNSTKKQVHWHSPISYNLCWDTSQLKDSWQHWKVHWHDDSQAHIEWTIDTANRTETLWVFFKAANIVFSKTQIWKYKNGDKCKWSDIPWKVSVEINWKENFEFGNYILNDKDEIKILFK